MVLGTWRAHHYLHLHLDASVVCAVFVAILAHSASVEAAPKRLSRNGFRLAMLSPRYGWKLVGEMTSSSCELRVMERLLGRLRRLT